MSVHIDDLSSDLLKYMMEFLPDKQLFLVERVSKKWQKCVKETLAQKENLKRLDYYSKKFVYGMTIDDNNIDILKSILAKCNNIKHLDLYGKIVKGYNSLVAIANLCPKLESIDLRYSFFDVSKQEKEEFAKMIGPQLRKCKLIYTSCDEEVFMIFLKKLKNIEEIIIESKREICSIKQSNEIFDYLNIECNNLQVLRWICYHSNNDIDYQNHIDYQNDNVINVIQRVQHLDIPLAFLSRFKCQMNNLNELTINGDYVDGNLKIEKTFKNLEKLTIFSFRNEDYDSISKFKFPKLESVSIKCITNDDVPLSFIHQIQNIKSFSYVEYEYYFPFLISQLIHLTHLFLIWFFDQNTYSQSFEGFDILSKHKTLQNIKLEINDEKMLIDKDFYDKLASLCHTKPKTKIIIVEFNSKSSIPATEEYINYKKMFEEAKHLHKLNMELRSYNDRFVHF